MGNNKFSEPLQEKSPQAKTSLDKALIGLSKEKRNEILVAFKQEVAYSGPIPPPEHFAQYEDVLPGAADRILAMAEREQEDRHRSNAMYQKLNHIGLWIGATLTLVLIGVASYAIFCGAVTAGLAIIGSIVAISVIYVLRQPPSNR